MKYRCTPEDFRVEEITSREFSSEKQKYSVYLLVKRGVETLELLHRLAEIFDVTEKEIGIAGVKDKYALTKQFFTVPSQKQPSSGIKDVTITHVGYTDKPLRLGDLIGNRFRMTVRDIEKGEIDGIIAKAATVPLMGVPNYIDSQRFGSYLPSGFIAKKILLGDLDEAISMAYGAANMDLPDSDFRAAYNKIPPRRREFFASAYQSFLWNECLKRLIRWNVDNKRLYTVDYKAGKMIFYKKISDDEKVKLDIQIHMICDTLVEDDHERSIIKKVLAAEGIKKEDMSSDKASPIYFRPGERKAIVVPQEFSITEPMLDDMYAREKRKRYMITVSFTLPKGCYATVVLKRIFNQ
ncbi:hypothetical protein COV93_08430 [Candidatus Woesearchaeota archaeon CG11_big_fil_rev_8_21_14_0_20_43_8]|nr:MAG: hypothetical protein COV93_08430 [Candidatus Woesearchaeota archaeon CG11_big_fil_rev_8_21_14_0_20_43_8]PIO05170.1 MAG: hypothetical protein COT47_05870 [Candidatus Woesearchaeota archaeon CG08_land_8_20_14_0_20_43_7]